MDRQTGAVLWTTKDPLGSRSEAPVSAANGVVFGCNLAVNIGRMVAMDANSGAILWSYDSGALAMPVHRSRMAWCSGGAAPLRAPERRKCSPSGYLLIIDVRPSDNPAGCACRRFDIRRGIACLAAVRFRLRRGAAPPPPAAPVTVRPAGCALAPPSNCPKGSICLLLRI